MCPFRLVWTLYLSHVFDVLPIGSYIRLTYFLYLSNTDGTGTRTCLNIGASLQILAFHPHLNPLPLYRPGTYRLHMFMGYTISMVILFRRMPMPWRVGTVMSQRKEFVALARSEGVIVSTVFAQWDQPQDWLQVAGRYLEAESSVWMISRSALIRTGRATTWSRS